MSGLTALIEAHSAQLPVPALAILAVAVGAALTRHVRSRPDGFLPRDLIADRRFRTFALCGFMLFAGYLIMVFAAPRLIATGRDLSAVQIGLILLPTGVVSAVASRVVGSIVTRTGPWPIVTRTGRRQHAGLLLAAAVDTTATAVVLALAACVAGFSAGQVTLAALAVNTVGMSPDPTVRLRDLARLLRPDGRIALVSQPRCPGATAATSATAADELDGLLTEAGFEHLRAEMLDLDPPAACVFAHVAPAR